MNVSVEARRRRRGRYVRLRHTVLESSVGLRCVWSSPHLVPGALWHGGGYFWHGGGYCWHGGGYCWHGGGLVLAWRRLFSARRRLLYGIDDEIYERADFRSAFLVATATTIVNFRRDLL